jgi:hypothetical protein
LRQDLLFCIEARKFLITIKFGISCGLKLFYKKNYRFLKDNGGQTQEEVPDRRGQQLHQQKTGPQKVTTEFESKPLQITHASFVCPS